MKLDHSPYIVYRKGKPEVVDPIENGVNVCRNEGSLSTPATSALKYAQIAKLNDNEHAVRFWNLVVMRCVEKGLERL